MCEEGIWFLREEKAGMMGGRLVRVGLVGLVGQGKRWVEATHNRLIEPDIG